MACNKKVLPAVMTAILCSCLMSGCHELGCRDYKNSAAANTTSQSSSETILEKELMYFDVGDYDPFLISEGNRKYDEQKSKYGKLLPNDYTNIPQESTYGIMTDMDNLMVSHMKYINEVDWTPDIYTDSNGGKVITLDYLDMQRAEIVFEDGSDASEKDISPGTSVLVQYIAKEEIFPGIIHCTKIVIVE